MELMHGTGFSPYMNHHTELAQGVGAFFRARVRTMLASICRRRGWCSRRRNFSRLVGFGPVVFHTGIEPVTIGLNANDFAVN